MGMDNGFVNAITITSKTYGRTLYDGIASHWMFEKSSTLA